MVLNLILNLILKVFDFIRNLILKFLTSSHFFRGKRGRGRGRGKRGRGRGRGKRGRGRGRGAHNSGWWTLSFFLGLEIDSTRHWHCTKCEGDDCLVQYENNAAEGAE